MAELRLIFSRSVPKPVIVLRGAQVVEDLVNRWLNNIASANTGQYNSLPKHTVLTRHFWISGLLSIGELAGFP